MSGPMDYALFRTVNGLTGTHWLDRLLTILTGDLPALLMLLVALTFLTAWRRHRAARQRGAVLGTASAALALLLNQPISHLVARPRPYLAHPAHAHLLIARSPDASFPSDHATGAFALAVGVWLYDRTIGAILLALAAVISFSRVYVGTHYPGDVLAGALIGAAVAVALHRLVPARRLLEAISLQAGRIWAAVLRYAGGRGHAGAAS
jgi:undecaprenyl-diphosphatase